jgi:hypothetical protein
MVRTPKRSLKALLPFHHLLREELAAFAEESVREATLLESVVFVASVEKATEVVVMKAKKMAPRCRVCLRPECGMDGFIGFCWFGCLLVLTAVFLYLKVWVFTEASRLYNTTIQIVNKFIKDFWFLDW